MQDMSKLLEKKKKDGKELDPMDQHAKLHVLKDLHGMAADAMHDGLSGIDKLKGMKKVTVASDSKEGLEHGLDKAHEMMDTDSEDQLDEGADNAEHQENKYDEETPEEEASESPDEETAEEKHGESLFASHPHDAHSDMSEEELDAKLKELMAKKEAMKKKK